MGYGQQLEKEEKREKTGLDGFLVYAYRSMMVISGATSDAAQLALRASAARRDPRFLVFHFGDVVDIDVVDAVAVVVEDIFFFFSFKGECSMESNVGSVTESFRYRGVCRICCIFLTMMGMS